MSGIPDHAVAIVGLSGRFPGAPDVRSFWNNLLAGVESITRFDTDDLEDSFGPDIRNNPNFVRARPILDGVDLFDAGFFGMLPREAAMTDPQHRVLLECAWEALEDAGYDPAAVPGAIGVFAGATTSTYFLHHVCADRALIEDFTSSFQVGHYPMLLGSAGDFAATRVSYKLGLTGPSLNVQSACSTSLLAVAQACQSLLCHACDMALAGGVSITFPQRRGYLAQEGAMVSTDGRCRPFDAGANGTVFGSGAGLVLLKRLEEAVADRDHVYAVIRGVGVNNDGADKVGFTAPSVAGQAAAIAMAHGAAGVTARSIGYVECHGTGTPMGDPIEVAGLTTAFRASTEEAGFCALGSLKSNVGHLDVAAGVAGLIKGALAVSTGQIPATLHLTRPNPRLGLDGSPFFIAGERLAWPRDGGPRRAGVSAFGVGGTNVHVVLEEAPARPDDEPDDAANLLVLSARSEAALAGMRERLAAHLDAVPDRTLADVAFTLQTGRRAFPHRCFVVGRDRGAIVSALRAGTQERPAGGRVPAATPGTAFMFPGQGSQYPNMGREIYASEPEFRRWIDACAEILRPSLDLDLRDLVYPTNGAGDADRLSATVFAQPAIFAVEYALARLWESRGIRPAAMIGHSVGEFAAACLAGVFPLEDALALVARRGSLMQNMPGGAMLAVRLPEASLGPLLGPGLSLAAINAPNLCVVSGEFPAVSALEAELAAADIQHRRLHTSHAFHSAMMEPLTEAFERSLARITFSPPRVPYVSCVTGTWITPEQATSPAYWARHAREPVRFADGLATLMRDASPVLLEVGPGSALAAFALQGAGRGGIAIGSMPAAQDAAGADEVLAAALGRLWVAGLSPDWAACNAGRDRRRVSLPTYPFERSRHWIDPPARTAPVAVAPPGLSARSPREDAPSAATQQDPTSMAATPTTRSDEPSAALRTRVNALFEDLSGQRIDDVGADVTFLELGFDSLLLTQAAQKLQTAFGVKIGFRQLLGDLGTPYGLARHLAATLPPEVAPPIVAAPRMPAPPDATAPALPEPAAFGSPAERLMQDQLATLSRLMEQQLQVLGGAAPSSRAVAPAALPPARPVPAPVTPVAHSAAEQADPPSRVRTTKTSGAAPLNETQRDHVAGLVARTVARSAGSKRMTAERRRPLADPRTVAGFNPDWKEMVYPIVAARAKGARFWDVDGNEYIDLVNGYGQTAFGHAPDFVVEAVEAQLRLGFAIGPQSPLAGEAASLFCELTGHERVAFCNTGSEAVMAALRVARTVTGRETVVSFAGDYHGQFDEVLVKGIGQGERRRSVPAAPGIPPDSVGNMVVLEYGEAESLAWLRQHGSDLAAVLVEPVQSRRPGFLPSAFLRELREITAGSGTALVFDEVVTGFRMHPAGIQGLLGIRPDLATYGKVVGGGLPIGLLAGTATFMDALDGGPWNYGDDSRPEVGVTFFAGTFVRHPLALAATLAVLRHVRERGPALQSELTGRMERLVAGLRRAFAEVRWPVAIESFGSLMYFEAGRDHRLGSLLYDHLRLRGVFVQEHYPCYVTTEHGDREIDDVVAAFRDSLADMAAGGLLPDRPAEPASVPAATARPTPLVAVPFDMPLSEPQAEIWLSAQLGPEASGGFTESLSLSLDGALDPARLLGAVRDVMGRHETLRATFSPAGDAMRVDPDRAIPVRELDVSGGPDPDGALRERIEELSRTPIDLVAGPVATAELVRLRPDRHVLLLCAHHIVCDGWSTNVLVDEIAAAYRSGASILPAPMPFSHYARRARDDERAGASLAYWSRVFSALPEPLDLPADRARPATRSFRGATRTGYVDRELYRAVKQAGARQRCTLFATLFSAFGVLLGRLGDQNEVVIGVPAAGQSLVEGTALVGHCVNFLPVRTSFDPDEPFAAYLARTSQTVLDAYDHQSCTLGTLLRRLAVKPEAGRLPLVEVQFNLERMAGGLDFGPGLAAAAEPNPKSFSTFDLFFNVIESDEGLRIDCDFSTDLFDPETIDRWIGRYRTLLHGIVADADGAVGRLPLVDEAEKAWLLRDLNRTAVRFPSSESAYRRFAREADLTPEAVAVSSGGRDTTYRELKAWADRIAGALAEAPLPPESRVGILVGRSPAMVAALLGCLKAGCPYVPLDPSLPVGRIRTILGESGAVALLTRAGEGEGALDPGSPILRIDVDRLPAGNGTVLPEPAGSHLAYVIYTSGSTGTPKGVEVTHGALANLLSAMAVEPGFGREDALLAVTTLTFDIAALELLLPLTRGGRVAIASADETRDGEALLARLASSGATALQATPLTWRLLLDAGFRSRPGFRMLCGGEALPLDLTRRLLDGGGELWNMYGPTETTIWSSVSRIRAEDTVVTVGRPIANTQFYVLDSQGEPAPIGVSGELLIGGAGVARGYAGRPDLTARSFVRDPFAEAGDARLYRTGDRARVGPDGRVELLGRFDHQVKLNGFRIEPGEIEAVLARKAGLAATAVILRDDDAGGPRLVCYFVPAPEGDHTPAGLRAVLANDLPDYMIPSAWVALPALPRNASGKLDRKALPVPAREAAAPPAGRTAVRTELEDRLARIWSEVLRIDGIGVDDDLFDLGADSLKIFQITARGRRDGLPLTARDLFRTRTIAGLAKALSASGVPEVPPESSSWKLPWRRPIKARERPVRPATDAASRLENV